MPHSTTDLTGRHVVITGGAGALGTAVVARFLAAGATVHVPAIDDGPGSRGLPGARYVPRVDLGDERQVIHFYAHLPPLWASVHLAGGHPAPQQAVQRGGLERDPLPESRALYGLLLEFTALFERHHACESVLLNAIR